MHIVDMGHESLGIDAIKSETTESRGSCGFVTRDAVARRQRGCAPPLLVDIGIR
jgi:hypothetical protein